MRVPLVDLDAAYRELQRPIDAAVARVLGSGRFILGPEVERFEAAFADAVGAPHCVGVGNGLDALTLSLAALDVGPGDEVIVPAATFVATWLAVARVGATPVPAPVDDATLNLDAAALEPLVTRRTRAVMPVHLYGHPADLDAVWEVARRHGLAVVDDAAQAHGAQIRDRPVGGLATATAFSFYPTKNLGAFGDGGAVTTGDAGIAERLRTLRNYGARQRDIALVPGYNSRLDELQAAVLTAKLGVLGEWNERRRRAAGRYRAALGGLDWLRLPASEPWATPVYHLFVVRLDARDELARHLAEGAVATAVHYPRPPYRQPVFADLRVVPALDALDREHDRLLSLPMGPHLSDAAADRVIEAILSFGATRLRGRPDHTRAPYEG